MNTPKRPSFFRRLRLAADRAQCLVFVGLYRLRRRARAAGSRSRSTLPGRLGRALWHRLGQALYRLGWAGEYALVRLGRRGLALRRRGLRLAGAAGRSLGRAALGLCRMLKNDLLLPPAVLARGVWRALRYAARLRRQVGLRRALWAFLCYLGRGVRLHARLLPRLGAYLLPLATGLCCFWYWQQALQAQYVLAVQVQVGESAAATVGYVQSERVFEAARADVAERLNYAGAENASWDVRASYRLAVLGSGSVLDERQVADALLAASGDEIAEGTALYLDGALCRITRDGAGLAAFLAQMKAPCEAQAGADTVVQFNHQVELVDGVYFTSSFSSLPQIEAYLTADQLQRRTYTVVQGDSLSLIASKNGLTLTQLCALNADVGLDADTALYPGDQLVVQKQEKVLEVQTVQTVSAEQPIPYQTVTSDSAELDFGVTRTVQQGQDGLCLVTTQITRDAAGNVLQTVELSRETLRKPVEQQVLRGTRLASGAIAQVGEDTFLWPVPGYRYCFRWYSSRHKGVDINAASGTPIYAAASGIVTKSGLNRAGAGSDYGYSVVIDHGNGYRTLYAHMVQMPNVRAGDTVAQGDCIGYVGSTGRSSGPHCHFEISHNGAIVPPQNLFPSYHGG